MKKVPVLYLSHDGILEPLGESQVLAYLELLAAQEFSPILISYEKTTDLAAAERRLSMEARLRRAGIDWHPMPYHRRPPVLSTLLDLLRGAVLGLRLARGRGIRLVHARSYPMSLIALFLRRVLDLPFLFDMRGFWPDERADSGQWKRTGALYRFFKNAERSFILKASAVVSLTEAGVGEMRKFSYLQGKPVRFAVIPTCADIGLFRPLEAPLSGPFVLGYAGSTGLWYDFAPVADVFRILRELRPGARLLLLTRDPPAPLLASLAEFPAGSVEVRSVSRAEAAERMRGMHATAFFIRPFFSKKASAPTRLAEFLSSGVPCLTNADTGDIARLLASHPRVGVAVSGTHSASELREAVRRLVELGEDPAARTACRACAETEFSLRSGATAYAQLYREVLRG